MTFFQMGETLELTIQKLVPGGEGLGHHEGFAVFVPETWPGDRVQARVISCKKNYARALLEQVIEPSGQRVGAPCALSADCGGCQWQDFAYPAQLLAKRQLLSETLKQQIPYLANKTADELSDLIAPVLGMTDPFYYRNKGQFPIQAIKGQLELGFFRPRSHDLVPLDFCLIHHIRINEILLWSRDWLRKSGLLAYDEKTCRGLLRHLIVRHGFRSGETLVALVCSEPHEHLNAFARELMGAFASVVGVVLNIQPKQSNRILGERSEVLAGQEYYREILGGLSFQVALPAFFQVNPVQTEVLYQQVKHLLDLSGAECLIDAYSGAGTIALWLAKHCQEVVGIESVVAATENARQNARINGLANAAFILGKVEDVLPDLVKTKHCDALVLDPPRKGCERNVLATIGKTQLERLVYVSCNPATLARDIQILHADGFELTACQPVDMFPHSHHIETVALLSR